MKKYLLFLLLLVMQLNAQCWEKIATGYRHTIAIKDDGTLWGWGANWRGQLAQNPDELEFTSPVQISYDNNWKEIDCGVDHSIAVKTDGTLWGWGYNLHGQVGIGEDTEEIFELRQIGTDNNWKSIFCGHVNTFAIKNDGTLWGWGGNSGCLGDGTMTEKNSPVQIGTDTDWEMIASASTHTLGIKTDGTLWAWGQA